MEIVPGASANPYAEARRDIVACLMYTGTHAPQWLDDMAIAQEAGIRAWEVDDMPAEWYYRIRCFLEARAEASKPKDKR